MLLHGVTLTIGLRRFFTKVSFELKLFYLNYIRQNLITEEATAHRYIAEESI